MPVNDTPKLKIKQVCAREWSYRLRMPFRFGNVTKTHGRQIAVRVLIELDNGLSAWGTAAESLSAKWFDKNPALTDAQNHDQLRRSLELARDQYLIQDFDTAFGHFAAAYPDVNAQAQRQDLHPLIASFGQALLDRCVIDALGRIEGQSFWSLMRSNRVGMRAAPVIPDLGAFDFEPFLAGLNPVRHLQVRHTVGLVDPISADDLPGDQRLNDGLPQTLAEVVAAYGHTYFKVKLGGNMAADLARLQAVSAVLDRSPTPYHVTLDGNEQYRDVASVLAMLEAVAQTRSLSRFFASILWLEQPIERKAALSMDVSPIDAIKPMIIDESDANLEAFPSAMAMGYSGVSSKNCKGLYKSIINLARCSLRNAQVGQERFFLSAEDLSTLPGISLQQDLALVSLLGMTHVEKNAHHFVDGMRHRPPAEQRAFVDAHADLYRADTLSDGSLAVRLRINGGGVDIGSLECPGFAHIPDMDWDSLQPSPDSGWPASVHNVT